MTSLGFQGSSHRPFLTTSADVRNTFFELRKMGYRDVQAAVN